MRIFLLSSIALLISLPCFAGGAPAAQPALPAKDIAAIKKLLVEYSRASFNYDTPKISALTFPDKEGNRAEYLKFLNDSDDVKKVRERVSMMGMCPPKFDKFLFVTFRKVGENAIKVGYCIPISYRKPLVYIPRFQTLEKNDGKYYVQIDKQNVESLKRGFEARTKLPSQIAEDTFNAHIKMIRGFNSQQLKEYQQEMIDSMADIITIREYAQENKIKLLGFDESIQDMQLEKKKITQMSPGDYKKYRLKQLRILKKPLAETGKKSSTSDGGDLGGEDFQNSKKILARFNDAKYYGHVDEFMKIIYFDSPSQREKYRNLFKKHFVSTNLIHRRGINTSPENIHLLGIITRDGSPLLQAYYLIPFGESENGEPIYSMKSTLLIKKDGKLFIAVDGLDDEIGFSFEPYCFAFSYEKQNIDLRKEYLKYKNASREQIKQLHLKAGEDSRFFKSAARIAKEKGIQLVGEPEKYKTMSDEMFRANVLARLADQLKAAGEKNLPDKTLFTQKMFEKRAENWLNLLSQTIYTHGGSDKTIFLMVDVPFYWDKIEVIEDFTELEITLSDNIKDKRDRSNRRRKPRKPPIFQLATCTSQPTSRFATSRPTSRPVTRKGIPQPRKNPKASLDFLKSCQPVTFTIEGDDEKITVWVNKETGMIQGIMD